MDDDDAMDRLLIEALAGQPPQLSRTFDDRVMGRVRPRRLTRVGQLVLAAYIVAAAAAAVWLMRDLPAVSIIVAAVISIAIGAGASAYGRHLALDQ
jgi:hypothetical protein